MHKLKIALGITLRIIALLWMANGLAGIVLFLLDHHSADLIKGAISITLGYGLFRLGTWVKRPRQSENEFQKP